MVMCKFFLQGYCRYGDNCRFEHQRNDHTKKNPHTSILWQSQLGNNQYQTQNSIFQKQNTVFGLQDQNTNSSSIVDIDTLVKSVVNDMEVIEKSGQWLLTCYGPFKEKPIFPGFEDFCFEEIRSGFYEAMKNGTIEQYKIVVSGLVQQAIYRIQSLHKPTPEVIEVIKNIYNTPVNQNNATDSSSIFGNSATQLNQPTFSAPNNSQSIFAQGNKNLFGNASGQPSHVTSSGNIFGGSSPANIDTQNTTHLFPHANTNVGPHAGNSIFGNQNNSIQPCTLPNTFTSTFGQPNQSNMLNNQSGSIFQQPSTTSPIFGNQSQVVQGSTSPMNNVYRGNPNIPQQTPAFGASPSTPQHIQKQTSIFGSQAGVNLNNSSLFQLKTAESTQSTNVFGSSVRPPVTSFDESLYSKLSDLTEDEIHWFQSDDLDPMKIPEKPPTVEMCFKT